MTSQNINFQVCGNLIDVVVLAVLEEVRPSKGLKTGGPKAVNSRGVLGAPRLRSSDGGGGRRGGPHLYTDFLYF